MSIAFQSLLSWKVRCEDHGRTQQEAGGDGFNPCYLGRCVARNSPPNSRNSPATCFNPCYLGRCVASQVIHNLLGRRLRFNPCYLGRCVASGRGVRGVSLTLRFNPCYLGRCVARCDPDGARLEPLRFNPCYLGRCVASREPCRKPRASSVSILVILEGALRVSFRYNNRYNDMFQSLLSWKVRCELHR